ncbi:hypothetical protein PENTCL1PPCAC_30049, partial [Pristionchus entomophagus]
YIQYIIHLFSKVQVNELVLSIETISAGSHVMDLRNVSDDRLVEARLRGVMDHHILDGTSGLAMEDVMTMMTVLQAGAGSVVVTARMDVGAVVHEADYGLGLPALVHLLDPLDLASAVLGFGESALGDGELLPGVVDPSEGVREGRLSRRLDGLLRLRGVLFDVRRDDLRLSGRVGCLCVLLGWFGSRRLLSLVRLSGRLNSLLLNLGLNVFLLRIGDLIIDGFLSLSLFRLSFHRLLLFLCLYSGLGRFLDLLSLVLVSHAFFLTNLLVSLNLFSVLRFLVVVVVALLISGAVIVVFSLYSGAFLLSRRGRFFEVIGDLLVSSLSLGYLG